MTSLGIGNSSGSLQEFDLDDLRAGQGHSSKPEENREDKEGGRPKEDATSVARAAEPTQQLLQLNCVCCCFSRVVCECSQARLEQSQWEVERPQSGRVIQTERANGTPVKTGEGDMDNDVCEEGDDENEANLA